jgi:hypothetical protein
MLLEGSAIGERGHFFGQFRGRNRSICVEMAQ